jgi:hypothetical protein
MIVSHKNRFIFFKPLKVAGSSLEFLFSKSCFEEDLLTGGRIQSEEEKEFISQNNIDPASGLLRFHSHTWPDLLYDMTGYKWPEYYKITAVRNPWDLCVSFYWWSISRHADKKPHWWRRLAIDPDDSSKEIKRKFEDFFMCMSHFDTIVPNQKAEYDNTLRWLSKTSERFIHDSIDCYISYERLDDDSCAVCRTLNLKTGALRNFKSSYRKSTAHYSEYYTDSMKTNVLKSFEKSIKKFNYRFEYSES